VRGFRGEQVRLFVLTNQDAVLCVPGGCVQSSAGPWITSTDRQDRLRVTAVASWFVRCLDADHGRRLLACHRGVCEHEVVSLCWTDGVLAEELAP